MRRVVCTFLFGALLLSAFAWLGVVPQRAFAASKVVSVRNVSAYHLLSRKYYRMGYRDGKQAGYQDGLTSCIPKEGPTASPSMAFINESYEEGFNNGYKAWFAQGKQKCEDDQVGGGDDGSGDNGGGDNSGGF